MNATIKSAAKISTRLALFAGCAVTALILMSSPARAEFDANSNPELALFAIGQFNGVYSRESDSAQVRLSFEETLYMTVGKEGLDGAQVIDVNQNDATITFYADEGSGPQINTLQRFADGVLWTHGDGSQSTMFYVRRLMVQDSLVIACNAYTVKKRERVLAMDRSYRCM